MIRSTCMKIPILFGSNDFTFSLEWIWIKNVTPPSILENKAKLSVFFWKWDFYLDPSHTWIDPKDLIEITKSNTHAWLPALLFSPWCKKEVGSRNSMQNLICSRWMLSVAETETWFKFQVVTLRFVSRRLLSF